MKKLLLIIFSLTATFTFSYAEGYNGTCGAEGNEANVTWLLDTISGVLTISGTGEMTDSNYPWSPKKAYIKSIIIEDGVTSIGKLAFSTCDSLTSVTLPNSVTSIGKSAFSSCKKLSSITLPDNVTIINSGTFRYCSALTEVHLPSHCDSLGNEVFYYCTALTSVTIPGSVTKMGDFTFESCTALSTVTFEDGVKTIGRYAFRKCTALPSVTIPGSVTKIRNDAFDRCTALTSVTFKDGFQQIDQYAFRNCISLSSVTIPTSVTKIEDESFAYCDSLSDIYVFWTEETQMPELSPYITQKHLSDITLHVPCGTEDVYKNNSSYWRYCNITEECSEPTAIDNVESIKSKVESRKILRNGQLLILRGKKIYTLQGQEVR